MKSASDPWEALRRLGPSRSVLGIFPWLAVALLTHSGALAGPNMTLLPMRQHVRMLHEELRQYFAAVEIEVVDDKKDDAKETAKAEPEPDPEPDAKPEPREKAPVEKAPVDKEEPKADAKSKNDPYGDEPPPQAAEAAAVLHQDEGEDLTGWSMPNKDGSTATPNGYTSSDGTAKHAVRDPRASSKGKEGGHGTDGAGDPGAKRVNHSRPAMPLSRNLSDCPFPPQADMAQVDRAVVDVMVSVDPQGRPTGAQVMADPGYGFGTQARRCALSMRYEPALGPEGDAIAGSTPTLRFRFNRQ